jgi:hypothetical protein
VNPRLIIVDFFKINALIWPNWWTPSDRCAAFRQVCICQGKVAAELVNREKFYMPPPPPSPTALLSLVAESPEGEAKGRSSASAKLLSPSASSRRRLGRRRLDLGGHGPAEEKEGLVYAHHRWPRVR